MLILPSAIEKEELSVVIEPGIRGQSTLIAACEKILKAQNIPFLRSDFNVIQNDDPEAVQRIAEKTNTIVQKVALEGSQLDYGPILGQKKNGAFVALLPGWEKYRIDTVKGESNSVLTDKDQFQAFYIFIPKFSPNTLSYRNLFHVARQGNRKEWWFWIFLQVIMGIAGLWVPWVASLIFDTAVPMASLSLLGQLLMGLVIVQVFLLVIELTGFISLVRLKIKASIQVEIALFDRLIRLPLSFYQNFTAGDLANRTLGVNQIQQGLSSIFTQGILGGIFALTNLALLFYLSPPLGFWAMSVSLVTCLLLFFTNLRQIYYQRQIYDLDGKIGGHLFQGVRAIRKIKITHAEEEFFTQWYHLFVQRLQWLYKANFFMINFNCLIAFMPVVAQVGLFLLVVPKATETSLGQFIFLISIFGAYLGAFSGFASAFIGALKLIPLLKRITPILEARTHYDYNVASRRNQPIEGRMAFKDVSFHHAGGTMILKNLSFEVPQKGFVAIVGPSGAGKSTILKLLTGLYEPTEGAVLLDGKALDPQLAVELRSNMGVVLQNMTLSNGSIMDNICNGGSFREEDVWQALKWVQMEEEVRTFPMGIETFLDEEGKSLSLGQRQRVLLARALIKKPKILILDEATSALDNTTQGMILKILASLDITRVIVAHRLSTIRRASLIMVIDQGELVQQGDYKTLASQSGLFASLIKRQRP